METLLFAALTWGLSTQWIHDRWAWGIEQMAIFGLALWLLMRYAVEGKRIRWDWSCLSLLGAAGIGCAQLAAGSTVDRWRTSEHVLMWITWSAAHWLALQTDGDKAKERFFRWAGCLSIALAVLAIVHRQTSGGKVFWYFETHVPFVMGVFPYENQYAAFILVGLPWVLMEALRSKENRFGWILGGAAMVASVVSSSSVAGAALVVIETILVVVWVLRKSNSGNKRSAALLAGFLGLAVVFGSASGWKDMLSDLERKSPLALRRTLTESTIEMARERWVKGWGLGTWAEVYPAYARFDDGIFDNEAHDDWAQWTAEGGIGLPACIAIFLAILIRKAWRSPLLTGLIMVLAYDLIEFHFQERPAFGCYYFAYAGAVLAAAARRLPRGDDRVLAFAPLQSAKSS
jgi:O-Antigen ligase